MDKASNLQSQKNLKSGSHCGKYCTFCSSFPGHSSHVDISLTCEQFKTLSKKF